MNKMQSHLQLNTRSTLSRISLVGILLLYILTSLTLPSFSEKADAISACDRRAVNIGSLKTDNDLCNPCPPTDIATSAKNVYLVGDSITAGAESTYKTIFAEKNIPITINGLTSRSLASTPPSPNGLQAIEQDAEVIKVADTVIIALGTNGAFTGAEIDSAIEKVKLTNATARIYWIDTAVVTSPTIKNPGELEVIRTANQLIYERVTTKGIRPISWFKTAFGQEKDPVNPGNDLVDINSYFADAYVHPNQKGNEALVNLVLNSINSGGGTPITDCACTPGSSTLVGADNLEKVWNYLLGKGFKPYQAAGFMGNFINEAHFEPKLVEYGWPNSRGEISKPGEPSSFDDHVPPDKNDKGQPGYGIVQWTWPTRKQALRDKALERSVIAGDLGLQLDFLWSELESNFKGSVLDPLMEITADPSDRQSVEAAVNLSTDIILEKYENPGGLETERRERRAAALEIYDKFAGGGGGSGDKCSTGTGSTRIVEIAQQELAGGANEADGTYLKYGGTAGQPWCAYFASWVFNEAGKPFTDGREGWIISYVPDIQAYGERNGWWHPITETSFIPQPGDLVIYGSEHVNIIVSVDPANNTITTIGGNEGNKVNTKTFQAATETDISGGAGITGYVRIP